MDFTKFKKMKTGKKITAKRNRPAGMDFGSPGSLFKAGGRRKRGEMPMSPNATMPGRQPKKRGS